MNLQAQWIAGFVDGEGCFHIGINKNSEMKLGYQVLPEFTVVQHERDIQVLHGLKAFFGVGVVRKNHGDRQSYRVRGIKHLNDIILPFFMKHRLITKKRLDFIKFRKVVVMMNEGKHLTKDGLSEIRAISKEMNNKLRYSPTHSEMIRD